MESELFWRTENQSSNFFSIECCTSFGVILFSFMEGERGSTFYGEWTISSHKGGRNIGEGGFPFGKVDSFFLLCNRFIERDAVGYAFLSCWRRSD